MCTLELLMGEIALEFTKNRCYSEDSPFSSDPDPSKPTPCRGWGGHLSHTLGNGHGSCDLLPEGRGFVAIGKGVTERGPPPIRTVEAHACGVGGAGGDEP